MVASLQKEAAMPRKRGVKRPGPTSIRLSKEGGDALREVATTERLSKSAACEQALLWYAEEVGERLGKPSARKEQGVA